MSMYSFDFDYRGISCRHTYTLPDDRPLTNSDHLNITSAMSEIVGRCRRMEEDYFSPKVESPAVKRLNERLVENELARQAALVIVDQNEAAILAVLGIEKLKEHEKVTSIGDHQLWGKKEDFGHDRFAIAILMDDFKFNGHVVNAQKKTFDYVSEDDLIEMILEQDVPADLVCYMNKSIIVPVSMFYDPSVVKNIGILKERKEELRLAKTQLVVEETYKSPPYDFSKHDLLDSGRIIFDPDYVAPTMTPEQVAYWKAENENRMTTIHAMIELQKERLADFLDRKSRGDTWFDRI